MSGLKLRKQIRRGFEMGLCWFCSHLLQRRLFVGPEQKKKYVCREKRKLNPLRACLHQNPPDDSLQWTSWSDWVYLKQIKIKQIKATSALQGSLMLICSFSSPEPPIQLKEGEMEQFTFICNEKGLNCIYDLISAAGECCPQPPSSADRQLIWGRGNVILVLGQEYLL